ncbi:MAG: hypothetical protein WCI59_09635 [Betaproteobacteria bacterium]|jgi:hypothetical protein
MAVSRSVWWAFPLAALLAAAPLRSEAQAIHLSRETAQAQVEKAFPKTRSGVELSEPDLQLDGTREVVVLCGRWLHAATQAGGTFCAQSRLQWNKEPATVSLAAVQLRSLALADGRQLPQALLLALNLGLPRLVDGTVVYTAPALVGWAVKDLRVVQDRLRIEF